MKKILFCTDLSESCNGLCQYISAWADQTDILVDVIHSYDPDLVNIPKVDMPIFSEFLEKKKKEMISKMEVFLAQLPKQNRGQYHLVEDVNRALAIRQTARRVKADLIVTGLRDRYTLMDKLIGSTSAKLVLDTDPPLMVIPYDRKYAPIQTVLYTTETSTKNKLPEREENALSWIYTHLDKDVLPSIHILHVTQEKAPTIIEEHPFLPMKFTATHSTDVVMGIIDYLESAPADIIAVHHKEKNLWDRIHKSSVAKNILYKAHMPILFI